MANEFLAAGDALVITGRDGRRLAAAETELRATHPGARLATHCGDAADPAAVDALAALAQSHCGTVHLWLNNAGAATANCPLADADPADIVAAVASNVTATLLGTRAAVRLMGAQADGPDPLFHVYNFGFSAWGRGLSRSAATHKATKAAVTVATRAVADECRAAGLAVAVHNLSPGMVLTDLLLRASVVGCWAVLSGGGRGRAGGRGVTPCFLAAPLGWPECFRRPSLAKGGVCAPRSAQERCASAVQRPARAWVEASTTRVHARLGATAGPPRLWVLMHCFNDATSPPPHLHTPPRTRPLRRAASSTPWPTSPRRSPPPWCPACGRRAGGTPASTG